MTLEAQCPVTGVRRQVDRGRRCVEGREQIGQRQLRATVVADREGGDALADGGLGRVLGELPVGVTVGIDESRRQHQAADIDHRLACGRGQLADLVDAVLDNAYVGLEGLVAIAVDDTRVDEQQRSRNPGRRVQAGDRRQQRGDGGGDAQTSHSCTAARSEAILSSAFGMNSWAK